MKYDLFLFDADDTLFDFTKSEALSFHKTLDQLGITQNVDPIFATYRRESARLWELLEKNQINKDFLKHERFRRTFLTHGLELPHEHAGQLYLDNLSENVVLLEHAVEICKLLSTQAELGIITNGIESVQKRRLKSSLLAPWISFIVVSEECGFAKPDIRFFEHSVTKARSFTKARTLVVGDRLETDILGAYNFGLDACLFNPTGKAVPDHLRPKYQISHLAELSDLVT